MRAYLVQQGDHLASIASRQGFDAAEVWNHEANSALRERRRDPNVLAPGDVLHIPEPPQTELRVVAKQTNRFEAVVPKVKMDFVVGYAGAEPLANERFVVEGLATPIEGQTDGAGRATFEVPSTAGQLRFVLPDRGTASVLRVGAYDPPSTRDGVRARLVALGYLLPEGLFEGLPATRIAEQQRHAFREALFAFQRDRGLDATGEPDEATQQALEQASQGQTGARAGS